MKIFNTPRQMGKSTLIANYMKMNKDSICIQPTHDMAKNFARTFKIEQKRVMSINEYLRSQPKKDQKIYMDEVGYCLGMIIKGKIIFGTHSNERGFIE